MSTNAPASFAQRLQQAWLGRGPLAVSLLPLSALFGGFAGARRGLFNLGLLRTQRLPVPVIVVGNLIAGGAGKTPTVIALVASLRRAGRVPGIVSRGHGGRFQGTLEVDRGTAAAACGDEPLLMHLRTRAPVVVGRDRTRAARQLLLAHPEVDVVISDDGLQHLALARDAQVMVFDERGAGNGWLLPAGPLREAVPRAAPPGTLVLYNAASQTTPLPGSLARRGLVGAVALEAWWRGEPATAAALEALRGRTIVAAAGIARPERFFTMLHERGLALNAMPLPDHHDYPTLPWPTTTQDVVVTEKDAIKLDPARVGATRVWVAPLDFAVDSAFESALLALLPTNGVTDGNPPA